MQIEQTPTDNSAYVGESYLFILVSNVHDNWYRWISYT